MTLWNYIAKWALGIFSGIILMALGLLFVPQVQKHSQQDQRLRELRAEKRHEEARLQDLRVRQERFQNDRDYVQNVAHEIGMVRPDEVIFKFYDEDTRYGRRDAN